MTAVIFGTYFMADLARHLFNEAVDDADIVPEWEPEVKNAHALRIQKLYDMLHILCPTAMSGPSYDWCMGYLSELRPDVVALSFGNPELCDLRASPMCVASSVFNVARTLTSPEFGVDLVIPVGAIPLSWNILCTESKYRKRAFGFNHHMISYARPKIGFKLPSGFWKSGDTKIMPSAFAPKSFIPGPEYTSPWFKKLVGYYRSVFLDGLDTTYDNRAYEAEMQQFE